MKLQAKKRKNMTSLSTTVLSSIVDEIEAAVSVNITSAREYHIRVFWETGKIIRNSDLPITKLIEQLAQTPQMKHLHMDERSLWNAVKVFDFAPHFEKVYETEHGQNISVSKLRRLTGGKEEKEICTHEHAETIQRCVSCHKQV